MIRNDHANQGIGKLHLAVVIAVGLTLGAGFDTELGHAALAGNCLGIPTAQPVKSGTPAPSCMDSLSQSRTVQGVRASVEDLVMEIVFGR